MAIADDSVWVTSTTTSRVLRLDPSSGKILAKVAVGPPPASATRPDPRNEERTVGVQRRWVVVPYRPVDEPRGRTYASPPLLRDCDGRRPDRASVGRPSGGGTVLKIDAVSGHVLATVPVDANPTGIAVYSGAVWVSCRGYEPGAAGQADAALVRLDYRTGTIAARVPLPGSVGSLVATDSQLVVSDPTSSQAPHRAGFPMNDRARSAVTVGLSVALLLAACATSSPPSATRTPLPCANTSWNAAITGVVNPSSKRGGTLDLWGSNDPIDSLDPARTYYGIGVEPPAHLAAGADRIRTKSRHGGSGPRAGPGDDARPSH